jgi:MYXO-CTERM domain-containing protein
MTHTLRVRLPGLAALVLLTQSATGQIQAVSVGTGFTDPLFAASAPGNPGTLYVVQQGGRIESLNLSTGTLAPTPLLDLEAFTDAGLVSGGERGLLGLAFHPNFQNNGLMYVKYTYSDTQVTGALRVEQYTVTNGVADTGSRRTVIQWDHGTQPNHNAGWIGFNPANGATGPNSGHLYVMTGDGGGANDPDNNAQDRGVLLGKVLRVDVGTGLSAENQTYTIPAGNMTGAGTLPELFSYGLRNPFRASFDRQTGDLYIGDVGQGAREEVNFIANGATGGQNFGWRLREGSIQTPGSTGGEKPEGNVDPIYDYVWGNATGRTVTGGYVYRGTAVDDSGQALDGTYIFGDYITGRIWSFRYDGTPPVDPDEVTDRTAELGFAPFEINISSFAEDGFGNLYVIDYSGGTVYRIVPVPEPAAVGAVAVLGLAAAAVVRRRRGGAAWRAGPAGPRG